jgi:magnesium chelatase subunit I
MRNPAPDAAPAQPLQTTLGELRATGHLHKSVKAEIRDNLLARMRDGSERFPGIVGFDETVLPQLERALLAGHDVVLLGERGQGKTRLIRTLVQLLDEWTPVVAGCEINDHPYEPVCVRCRRLVAESGDQTPVEWRHRTDRYAEKLATPDVSVGDLIGDVDPIKVAEGRVLGDPETVHFGLVPRTNRGIVAINELPDLAERIQVALLNVLEERDVQVRGYTLRLPLDVFVVASANPEDYTSRGRIITPLKDRLGSQIRTHYPRTVDDEIEIMLQERTPLAGEGVPELDEPEFMLELIAELTQLARRSPEVSQRSGVSVRVSIANLETIGANAVKRAVRLGEQRAAPRISDLPALVASTAGKVELETLGDETPEERVVDRLLARAIANVFARNIDIDELDEVVDAFESGLAVETTEMTPSSAYVRLARETPGLDAVIKPLGASVSPAATASAVEFVFEGLHLNRRLNKDRVGGGARYRR